VSRVVILETVSPPERAAVLLFDRRHPARPDRTLTLSARAQRVLMRWAFRDDLTGLLNRRGFRLLAASRLQAARRRGRDILLFYADLDGFKQINDRFGHAQGDQALTRVAASLRRTFRKTDIVARIGGDEFVALVTEDPGCPPDSVCRRLRENVARLSEDGSYQLSISVGVARWNPRAIPSLRRMMAMADRQLNHAKQGRPAGARPASRRLAV
jgi:diguanylate cyclase (GGDEF)-like protein